MNSNSPTKKNILFITGTRADFGKMKSLMRCVASSKAYDMHVLVTGMHMLKKYGETYLEVKQEGYENIYLIPNQADGESMSSALGMSISVLSKLIKEIEPNLIVVHGDRLEALAGAAVGALSNCLVCHIEGGELSGTVDDLIRHAVSKLSHIHMVANDSAKLRLLQMGEEYNNIYVIGSPDLDLMTSQLLPPLSEVKKHYAIDFSDYAISLFHPVTTEYDSIKKYARNYFSALKQSGDSFVVIYPNNDVGSSYIIDEIQSLDGSFCIFPSVRFESFLTLLKNAKYIIGNSSAGVREAPFYGIPAINVGTRQNRRNNEGNAILNSGYSVAEIIESIDMLKQFNTKISAEKSFGDGQSAKRFMDILRTKEFWEIKIQKTFVDM